MVVIGISAVALCGIVALHGRKPDLFHQRQTTLQSVQEMNSGAIGGFEEKWGELFVSIIDKHQDCHIYVLQHPGVSRSRALAILKMKKAELKSTPD